MVLIMLNRGLILFALSVPLASALKVTVVGGTGFVGRRVCEFLVEQGATVSSVSKSGAVPGDCLDEPWTAKVQWVANDLTRGARENLAAAIGDPDAIVSTVGAIGFDRQGLLLGNGVANVEVARAAQAAGVSRIVYVSVSGEVVEASKPFGQQQLPGYFEGKAMAEAAIIEAVGSDGACFVKPTFIYGGESFAIAPPRVTAWYGAGVEELLSTPPFRFIAPKLPGLLKVALRPPVSVDAVAMACAGLAIGTVDCAGTLDGTDSINEAAGMSTPVGIKTWFERLQQKAQSD